MSKLMSHLHSLRHRYFRISHSNLEQKILSLIAFWKKISNPIQQLDEPDKLNPGCAFLKMFKLRLAQR